MLVSIRWLRLVFGYIMLVLVIFLGIYYKTSIYLIYQSKGQLSFLWGTTTIKRYQGENQLSVEQKKNILLIERIKKYSVDSLDYKPTHNFEKIYDQKNQPVLWVITACEPYRFEPYEWYFPVVGQVTYKGFFKKDLAQKEYNRLVVEGYDVDLRNVSAWSTLGWLNDPVLSTMLDRSKGGLCNLLFHELFHATYYAAGKVDFNENIASFIAHKAALQFLQTDSLALKNYINAYRDSEIFSRFMLRSTARLKSYYPQIKEKPNKLLLKLQAIFEIADSIRFLPINDKSRFISKKSDIFKYKNAYFVDFQQYDSMQDSLEKVFNKIYKGNIKKMVQDLKQNKINY